LESENIQLQLDLDAELRKVKTNKVEELELTGQLEIITGAVKDMSEITKLEIAELKSHYSNKIGSSET
jgi:hypothetical protein